MPNKGVPVNLDRKGRIEHIKYHESLETGAEKALEMIEEAEDAANYANEQADRAKEYSDNIEEVMQDGPVQTVNGKTGQVTGLAEQSDLNEVDTRLDGKIDNVNADLDTKINDNHDQVTSQLAETATKQELGQLEEEKADKGALSQVAQSKRDKDVEIGMGDLDQEVREAFTGGSVAVVGEDSVGAVNLKANAVTGDKMDKNAMVKAPWLNDTEDDLDYVWGEGNYIVSPSVKNNPFNEGSFLKVERSKTQLHLGNVYIKQTLTRTIRDSNQKTEYRMLQVNENTGVINYKKNWEKILGGKVSRGDIDRYYNMAFPWLNSGEDDLDYVWETGTYMINDDVINNPTNDIAILEVVEAKTQPTGSVSWIKQIVTLARNGKEPMTYYRILQANVISSEIVFIHDWKIENSNKNKYAGVNWVALGTSMTSRGEYTSYVATKLGLNIDNRGVGSGGITSHAEVGNTTMQAVDSIEDFKGIVSVELGPNDWRGSPLGELGDRDENTWYGAVDKVCRTVSKRTSARLFFITSTTAAFQLYADFDESKRRDLYETNTHGHRYSEYVNAVKEVAQLYSIPVCDVFGESGLGSYHMNDQTLSDHIHLTNLGGKVWGNHIINFLKYKFSPFPLEYENPLTID